MAYLPEVGEGRVSYVALETDPRSVTMRMIELINPHKALVQSTALSNN